MVEVWLMWPTYDSPYVEKPTVGSAAKSLPYASICPFSSSSTQPWSAAAQSMTQESAAIRDALARAIRGRMGAVRACYERALRDDPQLAGRLELEMRVERVGTLSGEHARSGSIGDGALHDCIAGAVRSVRLPTGPDEPTTVSFPLVFAPQQ